MVTVKEALTAEDAKAVSGYSSIDYTINEDATVYDAVQKFAAFNIGCLVVTNKSGESMLFKFFVIELFPESEPRCSLLPSSVILIN